MRLTDFRNYAEATVDFGPGFNLVVGGNAQGKTSLLEAVYCLSSLGSHRASSSAPMIRHDQDTAYLKAHGTITSTAVEVDAQLSRGAGLKVWINKQRVGRSGKERSLAAVLFSPEDLELIKGGPELRRRYLDHAVGRAKPVSNADRLSFEKAIRQRNGVLKAARSNPRALRQLEVWNQQVALTGAAVFENRKWVLERLGPAITRRYGQLAAGQQPRLSYQSSWAEGETQSRSQAEEQMLKALETNQSKDLETTTTSAGPHRDDLAIDLAGVASRWYASQGEQRSLSLAMRLAERDVATDVHGEEPILLLDDVFSELDERRRHRLAELVSTPGQAIVTATSADSVPLDPDQTLLVEDGRLTRVA